MNFPIKVKAWMWLGASYCLFLCFFSFAENKQGADQISLEGDAFSLIIDGHFSQDLTFTNLPVEKDIYLTYWGAVPKAKIEYGLNSLSVNYRGNATETVFLSLGRTTKTINFHIQGKPAQFEQDYIQRHTGKVSAEIPEVYELTNIILALADKYHQTNYGSYAQGSYYQDILKWFWPFKEHAVFSILKDVDYYSLVENGPAYVFENDKIKPSAVYNGFRAKDAIKDNLALLEDFAKTSQFRAFYQQQKGYYQSLTDQFLSDIKPYQIWRWLESQIPARYQSYQVYFSPLGAGKHSARMYTDNGFKQAIMFISGPNRYQSTTDSASIRAIKLSRTFFTEIDHAYVNPISNNYVKEITQALPDLSTWYKGGGYNNPYSTFNEYMTWSVFLLYAQAHYSAQDYLTIKRYVESFMQEKRGFYKFAAFNRELTRLYNAGQDELTVVDLYPAIISWVKGN